MTLAADLQKHKPLASLWLFALLASSTLAAAWGFQILGGFDPCPLCLQQRWPYYASIPLTLFLIWWAGRSSSPNLLRWGLLLIAFIMISGAAVALYHAGVEWKWWPGPRTCGAAGSLSPGLPDLTTARVIRCDEAPWRLLGLSFAGWNLLISFVLATIALHGARQVKA
jgi:disulfide bond formation protein DsbB